MSEEPNPVWKRVLKIGCRYYELYHSPYCDDEEIRPYLELADQGLFIEHGPTEPNGTRWRFELTEAGYRKARDEQWGSRR
jgi:hypothetical protein